MDSEQNYPTDPWGEGTPYDGPACTYCGKPGEDEERAGAHYGTVCVNLNCQHFGRFFRVGMKR